MFAGIGGFRAGPDRAGGFACVGHCEIVLTDGNSVTVNVNETIGRRISAVDEQLRREAAA